jgi:iron(III) transport system permease protein
MSGTVTQLGPELEEAARISGATWGRAFYDVVFKLVRIGGAAALLMIAYGIIGNLTLPILLSAPGTQLLSVELLRVWSTGNSGHTAVVGVIMLVTIAFTVLAARALMWRPKPRESTASQAPAGTPVRNGPSVVR